MRARSRWLTPLAAGAVGALVASCTASRGSIGADCLKDEDCISGVCAELTCAASPTYLDGEANLEPDAEASADGEEAADAPTTDVAVEAAPDAPLETPEATVADTGAAEEGSSEGSTTPIVDASGEASARLREVKQKRVEILSKRLQRFTQAEESRAVVSHQLASIEDLLRLTHEQSIAIRDPEHVNRQLDALSVEVQATEDTVREMEQFMDFADEAAAPLPHGVRVR